MTLSPNPWLTRRAAALRAGLNLRTVDRMLSDGRLTRHKDGLGRVRIDTAELDGLTTLHTADDAPQSA